MTDIVRYEPKWVSLLEPAAELARQVGKTEFVPGGLRDRNAAIAACVLYGDELGIGPMQSLAQIAVIEGRPAPSAQLARGLALAAGHEVWVEESTSTKATVKGRRRDSDHEQACTWTIDDARRAGLDGKRNWRAYPRQMLLARATAELVRFLAPDVLGGLTLTREELEDDGEAAVDVAQAVVPAVDKPKRAPTRRSLAAVPPPEAPSAAESTPQAALSVSEPKDDALPPEPEPAAPTDAQRKLMFALFRDMEVNETPARHRLTAKIMGREVSSKDLTAADMAFLLDELQRLKAEGFIDF